MHLLFWDVSATGISAFIAVTYAVVTVLAEPVTRSCKTVNTQNAEAASYID